MKCSLGISNFLEETSNLSHSIVFLYFLALITKEGFLFSSCYSLELCTQMDISFLFSFAFCSSPLFDIPHVSTGVQSQIKITECFLKKLVYLISSWLSFFQNSALNQTKPLKKSQKGSFSDFIGAHAAKSFQLCPTLCDPIDGSPPGSPIPGILQARTLEWVAISFSNA